MISNDAASHPPALAHESVHSVLGVALSLAVLAHVQLSVDMFTVAPVYAFNFANAEKHIADAICQYSDVEMRAGQTYLQAGLRTFMCMYTCSCMILLYK